MYIRFIPSQKVDMSIIFPYYKALVKLSYSIPLAIKRTVRKLKIDTLLTIEQLLELEKFAVKVRFFKMRISQFGIKNVRVKFQNHTSYVARSK